MVDGHWRVLLTRRTRTVEHHKGEISFSRRPRDDDDPDLQFTALRESEEEVGIRPAGVEVLGRLDDIYTISNYRVRPFVGRIPYPFTPRVQPAEIDELIFLPWPVFSPPAVLPKPSSAALARRTPSIFSEWATAPCGALPGRS